MGSLRDWWLRHRRTKSSSAKVEPWTPQPVLQWLSPLSRKADTVVPTTPDPSTEPHISSQNGMQTATPSHQSSAQGPPPPSEVSTVEEMRCQMWNEAYDATKEHEGKLVDAYETILSAQILAGELAPSIDECSVNKFTNVISERQDKMKMVVDIGLSKTKQGATRKDSIKKGMQPIQNVKGFVSAMADVDPTAAVAWAGITTCMDVIGNSASETDVNREGLEYVRDRIRWYWDLSELLFNKTQQAGQPTLLLRRRTVQLYKQLLTYQMWSVCLYHRSWATVILRDFVRLGDRQGKLDGIKAAESSLRQDIQQHGTEQHKLSLHRMDISLQKLQEQVEKSVQEIREIRESDLYNRSMKALSVINPRIHKKELQDLKGGLLKDPYRWILQHKGFCEFRDTDESKLLWIKGDPGKGKTMLVCGIIDELKSDPTLNLSYFFCQATRQELKTSTSVLRGLIWLLCNDQPRLISHLKETYNNEPEPFTGHTAFKNLRAILFNMLRDPLLEDAILMVDALDECSEDSRDQLIDLVIHCSRSYRAKWIVSSRNLPTIEERFSDANKCKISLELNQDSISQAVKTFIKTKLEDLSRQKHYEVDVKEQIYQGLLRKANGTFLWVSLACLALSHVNSGKTIETLDSIPAGLGEIYERMLTQIADSQDGSLYKQILATAAIAFRPLRIDELHQLVVDLKTYDRMTVEAMIRCCGSFLTIKEGVVYLAHQSAQDFLLGNADKAFSSTVSAQHHAIFRRSLDILERLKRDMYNLDKPGVLVEEISRPTPDPLCGLEYSCVYWVDHLEQIKGDERKKDDDEAVKEFMEKKLLHWLEALSLRSMTSEGIWSITNLRRIMANTLIPGLAEFVEDARRFVLRHRELLQTAPLQIYVSALEFTPPESLVRRQFEPDEADYEVVLMGMEAHWDACVHKFERQRPSVAFSPVSHQLVCGSRNDTGSIEVWDLSSMRCTRMFEVGEGIRTLAVSSDESYLAVGLQSHTIQILDFNTGSCIRTMTAHDTWITDVVLSPDGKSLASCSIDGTIKIWDVNTGERLQTMRQDGGPIWSVSFSADGQQLASGGIGSSLHVVVWDVATGERIWTGPLDARHPIHPRPVTFLTDGTLAFGSDRYDIQIWDTAKNTCLRILKGHADFVISITSLDRGRVAAGSADGTIRIWDNQGTCVQTLNANTGSILDFSFDAHTQLLASASSANLQVWDLTKRTGKTTHRINTGSICKLALSPDGQLCASSSSEKKVKIWDTSSGACLHTFESHYLVTQLEFSPNAHWLLARDRSPSTAYVWDVESGDSLGSFSYATQAGFTSPSSVLVVLSYNKPILTWDIATQEYPTDLIIDGPDYSGSTFCPNTENIAITAGNKIFIHNVITGQFVQEFEGDNGTPMPFAFSSSGKYMALRKGGHIEIRDTESHSLLDEIEAREDGNFEGFNSKNEYQLCIKAYNQKKGVRARFETDTLDWGTNLPDRDFGTPSHNYGLSEDKKWITNCGERTIWLPQEYRYQETKKRGGNQVMEAFEKTMMIGSYSGNILLIRPAARK